MPRKPKAARATEPTPPETAPARVRRGRPPRAAKAMPKPAEAEDSSAPGMAAAEAPSGPAEMTEAPAEHAAPEAEPAAPLPAEDAATPSKPAAHWDAAAGTARFDWPEIERTASRPGPNQVMAKLLIAACAEGANSRWPFQAA